MWAMLLLVLITGCPSPETPTVVTQPFAGEEVRMAVPAESGLKGAWEVAVQDWSAETGAAGTLSEYSVAALSDGVVGKHDLVVFPWSELSALASAGKLLPVPKEQLVDGKLNWFDHFQGLRENICSWEQQPIAVPLASPVLVCYVREDLLQNAGLKAPQTWDEYQTLLDRLPEWAPGLTAVEPWSEDFRATMFLARAVSYAKHPGHYSLYFDIESGDPLIDSPGFVRALAATRQALQRMPADVLKYGPHECRREFLAGRAALAIALETGSHGDQLLFGTDGAAEAHAADKASRPEEMVAGIVPLPGQRESYNQTIQDWEAAADGGINRVALTGFAGLAVGISAGTPAARAEACWNALAYLLDPQQGIVYPGGTRLVTRESDLTNSSAFVGPELSSAEAYKYGNAVAVSLRDRRLVAELPVLNRELFRAALTRGLTAAVTSDIAPADCLAAVRAEWSTIAEQVGKSRLRNQYRSVLGLYSLNPAAIPSQPATTGSSGK